MALSICSFVRLSVCRLKRVLVEQWPPAWLARQRNSAGAGRTWAAGALTDTDIGSCLLSCLVFHGAVILSNDLECVHLRATCSIYDDRTWQRSRAFLFIGNSNHLHKLRLFRDIHHSTMSKADSEWPSRVNTDHPVWAYRQACIPISRP